jgi:hypothetical protein
MTKYVIGLAVGVALTLALAAVGIARDKEEDAKAQKEVLEVTDAVEKGKSDKDLAAMAKDIKDKKNMELDALMKVYKNKNKGGVGFGAKPADDSGIEKRIQELQRTERGPAVAVLKKEGKDIIKMAYLNIAMAEIAKPHFNKPMEGKTKKDWDKWLDDQKKAAKDLIEAVKKEDSKAVAKAAKELQNACTECHSVFRK